MFFGLGFRPIGDVKKVVAEAVMAEKVGFDYLWGWEDPSMKDVFMYSSIIAMNTRKVKVGPMAFYPYLMNPAMIASAALTLNEASKGRAVIGLAAGKRITLNKIGLNREKPITYIKEVTDLIKALATGREVSYEGTIVRTHKLRFPWVSGRPILLYVSGNGPKMLRIAGMVADGVNMAHVPAEYLPEARRIIKNGAEEAGKNYKGFEIQTSAAFCFIADDYDSAMARAKKYWYFSILPSLSFTSILQKAGLTKSEISIIRNVTSGSGALGPHMPNSTLDNELIEKILRKFALVGTIEDCVNRLKEYKREGLRQFRFGFTRETDIKSMIEIVGKSIIPALRD